MEGIEREYERMQTGVQKLLNLKARELLRELRELEGQISELYLVLEDLEVKLKVCGLWYEVDKEKEMEREMRGEYEDKSKKR